MGGGTSLSHTPGNAPPTARIPGGGSGTFWERGPCTVYQQKRAHRGHRLSGQWKGSRASRPPASTAPDLPLTPASVSLTRVRSGLRLLQDGSLGETTEPGRALVGLGFAGLPPPPLRPAFLRTRPGPRSPAHGEPEAGLCAGPTEDRWSQWGQSVQGLSSGPDARLLAADTEGGDCMSVSPRERRTVSPEGLRWPGRGVMTHRHAVCHRGNPLPPSYKATTSSPMSASEASKEQPLQGELLSCVYSNEGLQIRKI